MIIRGAPAIGVAAAMGVALGALQARGSRSRNAGHLRDARQDPADGGESVLGHRPDGSALRIAARRAARRDSRAPGRGSAADQAAKISPSTGPSARNGAPLVPDGKTVLTHCNAGALATAGYGTALGVIRAAVEAGKKIDVFADETRPFLQGARLTAWELQQDGIQTTLITDNMAGHFLKSGRIGCVVVGADRIAANGDVANKIGTYSVAVLAKENDVPFYVAAPISTLDLTLASGDQIPIEERAARGSDACAGRPRCAGRHTRGEPRVRRDTEPLRDRDHHGTRRGARPVRGKPASPDREISLPRRPRSPLRRSLLRGRMLSLKSVECLGRAAAALYAVAHHRCRDAGEG